MRRQLQIRNGIAQSEWQGSGGMPVPPDASWTFLDVSDRAEAQVGHSYDANTDTFSPPPPGPTVLSYNEFIQLFTAAERKNFRALTQTNADAEDLYDLLQTSPRINLSAPKTAQFLSQLVTLGVLTAARRTAILNA